MSYQLIKVPLQNTSRVVRAVEGLSLPLGPISANDATTLQASVVVAQVSGGFTTANLYLEQSKDAGATWSVVPSTIADTITSAGTFSVYLTSSSGILFPNVRLVITVNTIGESLLLSEVYRTFTQGQNIVPPGAVGGASEATLLNVYNAVDGLETAVASTNTKLDTIAGYVDGLETAVASTNTKLDTLHTDIGTTIAGYVDGIESALTTLNAEDFATETTLAKTRKWPYATHNTIVPTEDVNNEYYTYKNSGGTTVGIITIAKATGIITYSPDKVV